MINQEDTEVGESVYELDADETGMEFPTVDMTASRIQKKMKKKHQDKLKKMKKNRNQMETNDCCQAPSKENC
jgi:hypothetical protein